MPTETRSMLLRFAVVQVSLLVTAVQGEMWFTSTYSDQGKGDCNKTGGGAETADPSASSSAVTTSGQSTDATTIVKQVFLILAVGVAMSTFLLLITYLQLRYCKNCGPFGVARSPSNALPQRGGRGQRQRAAVDTSLAAQAKLKGMSCQERIDVLEHLFQPCIVTGVEGASHSHDVEAAAASSHHTTSRDLESYHNNDDHVWEGDELPKDTSCSICLSTLRRGGRVLETPCKHRFHYKCCQEWLQKRDTCPYCRADLYTVDQLRRAALDVLGKERVEQLGADHEGLDKAAEPVSDGNAVTVDDPQAAQAATAPPSVERRDESV
jgi:Ring finger domain